MSIQSLAVIWPLKSNYRTSRIQRYCCPTYHTSAPMLHSWNQAFRIIGLLGHSPNINLDWCWEQHEWWLIWQYYIFPIIRCQSFMITTPTFSPFGIAFSNKRFSNCSPTMDVGFLKLSSDPVSSWNRVFKMHTEFCRHLRCYDFWTQSSSISVNPFHLVLVFGHYFS